MHIWAVPSTATSLKTSTPDVYAQIAVGPPLKRKKTAIPTGGPTIWANKATKVPDDAIKMVQHFTASEAQVRLNEVYNGGRPPSRKSLTTHPKVVQFPFVKEFMELATNATTDPAFTKFAQARNDSSPLLVEALLGAVPPQQALQESEHIWNVYLAQSD